MVWEFFCVLLCGGCVDGSVKFGEFGGIVLIVLVDIEIGVVLVRDNGDGSCGR